MRGPTYPHAGTQGPSLEQLWKGLLMCMVSPKMPNDYKKDFETQARGIKKSQLDSWILDELISGL